MCLGFALLSGIAAPLAGQAASAHPRSEATVPASAAGELAAGRRALAGKQYGEAERRFRAALRAGAGSVPARLGLADAELALHAYEPAELDYRRVVAAEPQLWVAHKNLVIVEAALGRWEEFDRERSLLRAARARGAEGLSAHESDVIDSFTVGGKHWIVREYFEPVGRSEARYNFESFDPDGRIRAYISLEPEAAAQAALTAEGTVRIGEAAGPDATHSLSPGRYALNWYTGKAHGVVRAYSPVADRSEPAYERVRADVLRWLRTPPSTLQTGVTP